MFILNNNKSTIDNVGEISRVWIQTNGTKRSIVIVEGTRGEHAEYSYYGDSSFTDATNTIEEIFSALKCGELALKINYTEGE